MKRRVIMMFLCMLMMVKSASLICANESDEVIREYGELNQANVEQFFDDELCKQLQEDKIAGVTVSVVKDGELLFAKSYGYSNYEKQIPYNTETMTRVGSISKVFVWQSILQLADEGKIDIDNPISDYVDGLSYENPYDTRITIRHLMTHTGGFEDELSTLFVKSEDTIQSLLDDKRKVMYEPGTVIAYSNYGAAIAGLIVERVSGQPLYKYINKHIFEPIGMERSTFLEPARDYFGNVSYGHIKGRDGLITLEDPSVSYAAAGAMMTTSLDMAKYMLLHLEEPDYIKSMHETAIAIRDNMPGLTLGMMEWKRNKLDIIWHSGGNVTFNSMLLLIPEEQVGLFISYNVQHGESSRNVIREAFLDAFYPVEIRSPKPMEGYKERTKMYEGYYKEGRGTDNNSDRLIYLLSRTKKLSANEDATISFRNTTYVEVDKGIFKEVNGQGKMVITFDEEGKPYRIYQDDEPHEVYLKMKTMESPPSLAIVFFIGICLLITGLIWIKRLGDKDLLVSDGRRYVIIGSVIVGLYPIISTGYLGVNFLLNPLFLVDQGKLEIFKSMLVLPIIGILLVIIGYIFIVPDIMKRMKLSRLLPVFAIHCVSLVILNALYIYMRLFGYYII